MRILFVINTMGRGGAEVQVRDLALRLVQQGERVAVVVLLPYEDFEAQLRAGGVETFSLGMTKGVPTAQAVVRLLWFERAFRPDVVHAHLFGAIMLTRLAFAPSRALFRRPAVLGTVHSRYERSPRRYRAYRVTHGLSDAFTCVSHRGIEEHERHRSAPAGSMRYTPNGIDVAAFRLSDELRASTRATLGVGAAFVWLAIGSFRDEDKDYGTMLRAFVLARNAGDWLLLAGEGRLVEETRSLATSLGVADSVRFLGLRFDIRGLLSAADGYVLSSASEAMPIVLLEAGSAELPVVATNVGDVDQIVSHGKTGFVCPPKDAEALAGAMRTIRALTPTERRELGARALRHVEARFDLETVTRRWIALYEGLVRRT